MKVYTVSLRQPNAREILIVACDNYQYALNTYHKEIDRIDSGVYSNAIGVKLYEWEQGKPILLQLAVGGWYKPPPTQKKIKGNNLYVNISSKWTILLSRF